MEVSEQVIAVIDALCERFGVVVDFTQNNIISYIQELCQRAATAKISVCIIWIIFSVILLVILCVVCVISYKNRNKIKLHYDILDPLIPVTVLFSIFTIFALAYNTRNIVIYRVLPEKALIDFIGPMLKL